MGETSWAACSQEAGLHMCPYTFPWQGRSGVIDSKIIRGSTVSNATRSYDCEDSSMEPALKVFFDRFTGDLMIRCNLCWDLLYLCEIFSFPQMCYQNIPGHLMVLNSRGNRVQLNKGAVRAVNRNNKDISINAGSVLQIFQKIRWLSLSCVFVRSRRWKQETDFSQVILGGFIK